MSKQARLTFAAGRTLHECIEARLRHLESRCKAQADRAADPLLSREERTAAQLLGTAYTDLYYWLVKDLEECGE